MWVKLYSHLYLSLVVVHAAFEARHVGYIAHNRATALGEHIVF